MPRLAVRRRRCRSIVRGKLRGSNLQRIGKGTKAGGCIGPYAPVPYSHSFWRLVAVEYRPENTRKSGLKGPTTTRRCSMFCRNCGGELAGTPGICSCCGAMPQAGSSHCQGCGAKTHPRDAACAKCGVGLLRSVGMRIGGEVSQKSRLATALLALWLGAFGLHRFYLGKYGTAIAMLALALLGFATWGVYVGAFLFLAAWSWAIVDLALLLLGKTLDAQGRMVLRW